MIKHYLGEFYCDIHQEKVSHDGCCDACISAAIEDHIDTAEEEFWQHTQPEGGFTFGDDDEE